jgi:hypothetical protein
MRMLWPDPRCIICLESKPLTDEHLIPEAIGGRLAVRFLCKPCNDRMGELESRLKQDPAVRLAVEHLRPVVPKLADSIDNGQKFFVTGDAGRMRGSKSDGVFKIRGGHADDGSLILPTDEARKALGGILRKAHSEAEVHEMLARFDAAPNDVPIDLGELWAIKRAHDDPRPALVDPRIDDVPVLKMAYEFLACHLMSGIYNPRLDEIRAALHGAKPASDVYRVERVRATGYRPIHGIVMERSVPHVVIQIRLFGWYGFRVHFLRIAWGGDRYVYTLDLATREHASRPL